MHCHKTKTKNPWQVLLVPCAVVGLNCDWIACIRFTMLFIPATKRIVQFSFIDATKFPIKPPLTCCSSSAWLPKYVPFCM